MRRTLAVVGFTWLLTLVAAAFLGFTAAFVFLLTAAAGTLVSFLVPGLRKGRTVPAALLSCTLALTSFCLTEQFSYLPIAGLSGQSAFVTGYIADLPEYTGSRYRYTFQITSVDLPGAPQECKVTFTNDFPLNAEPFDELAGEVTFSKPYAPTLLNWKTKGVYLTVRSEDGFTFSSPASKPFYSHVVSLRAAMLEQNRRMLSSDAAELINGVLLGADDFISPAVKQDFRDSGISHLLAVSGTHIVILTGFVMLLLRRVKGKTWIKNLTAAGFVLFFMALTGFTPSVVRAGIMMLVVLMGGILHRKSDPLNSLGLAALVLTVFHPYAAASIGLLMSFSATLGIILLASRMDKAMSARIPDVRVVGGLLCRTSGVVAQSLAATLFNLPILILVFGQLSLVAPLTNVLVMTPASGMLLCGSLGSLLSLLGPVSFLGYPFSLAAGLLARYLQGAARFCASLPFSTVSTAQEYFLLWLCGTLVLVAAALLLRRDGALLRTTALLSAIVLFCGVLSGQLLNRGVLSIAVIGSEGGSSVVLTKDGRAAVIGCGGAWDIGWETSEYLKDCGVKSIDLLILPKLDEEYASGAGELLEDYEVTLALLPQEGEEADGLAKAFGEETIRQPYASADIRLWDGVDLQTVCQGEESLILIRCGSTNTLFATEGADAAACPEPVLQACLFHGALPASFHRLESELLVMTGDTKTTAPALIRMEGLEKTAFGAPNDTFVLSTRGNADVMVQKTR